MGKRVWYYNIQHRIPAAISISFVFFILMVHKTTSSKIYSIAAGAPYPFNASKFFSQVFDQQHIFSSGIDFEKLVPGIDADTKIDDSLVVLFDDDVDYLLYDKKRTDIFIQKEKVRMPFASRVKSDTDRINSQIPLASNRREIIRIPNDKVLEESTFEVNLRDWHDGGRYRLCIATTFAPVTSPRRWNVQNNTMMGLKFLGNNVLPVIMYNETDFDDICKGDNTIMCVTNHEVNPYGMPIMRSIFGILENLVTKGIQCDYYGYVNGDILLSPNMELVLRTIKKHQEMGNIKKNVLVVGRRLNKEVFDRGVFKNVFEYSKFINEVYVNEPLYSVLALDYFIYNKGTFDLSVMPPIVIGRGDIDAWQFSYAYERPDVDLINTSDSIFCVHQTDERGVGSGVFNLNKEPADTQWNRNVIQKADPKWVERSERKELPTSSLFCTFFITMMYDRKLLIERRDGYGDVFNDFEVQTLRPYMQGKSCLYITEGRTNGTLINYCDSGTVVYHDLSINKERYGVDPKFGYRLFMVQKCPDPKGQKCFSYDEYTGTSIGNFDDEQNEAFSYKRKEYDIVFLDGEVRDEFLYKLRKMMKSNTKIIIHDTKMYRYHYKIRGLINSNEYKVMYSSCNCLTHSLDVSNSSSPYGFAILGRRKL